MKMSRDLKEDLREAEFARAEFTPEAGRVYVVRVYRHKMRKHKVTFLGIGIRSKKPDLTNIQNAHLFEHANAVKIVANTPSVDGVQYHIMLHSEALESEQRRANKK
jgi:hypothetical protein